MGPVSGVRAGSPAFVRYWGAGWQHPAVRAETNAPNRPEAPRIPRRGGPGRRILRARAAGRTGAAGRGSIAGWAGAARWASAAGWTGAASSLWPAGGRPLRAVDRDDLGIGAWIAVRRARILCGARIISGVRGIRGAGIISGARLIVHGGIIFLTARQELAHAFARLGLGHRIIFRLVGRNLLWIIHWDDIYPLSLILGDFFHSSTKFRRLGNGGRVDPPCSKRSGCRICSIITKRPSQQASVGRPLSFRVRR